VPELAALIGRAMMLVGALLVVAALLALLPGVLRVRRRALALRASVRRAGLMGRTGLAGLEAQRAEARDLLAPWLRLRRWWRSPLAVATREWYGRRRRDGRERA
jgi:hypothetical protein